MSAQELISTGVSVATFAPQPFWLLMIVAPTAPLTRKVMGSPWPILGLSLVHFGVVVLAASQPGGTQPITIFADVFDPSQSQLDGMRRLFEVPNFVAEEWPHVLICEHRPHSSLTPWLFFCFLPDRPSCCSGDLFVGRAIWMDGLARKLRRI